MQFARFLLLSAVAVVAFDAVASVASAALHFPYQYASLGSVLLYVTLAFLAACRFGFWRGVLLGAVLGLVDATAGWAVSWAIGPGQVPSGQFSVATWAATLVMMIVMGAFVGLIGAGFGTWVRRSRAA